MSELEFIYRVAFNEPPLENDDSGEFYFTSLSAILREVHARTGGLQGVSPVESENHSR